MRQKVKRLQAHLRDLKGKSSDNSSASNTLDPLNQKLESKIVELEFQVVNYKREIGHLKTTYKNLKEFNVMKHRNVIAPGMFKIDPSQTSTIDLVPNKQSSASFKTRLITNSQRHVTSKENVSSDTVNASSTGLVHTAKTRRPQPKGTQGMLGSLLHLRVVKSRKMNIKLLINFVWKFLGTIRFGNDNIATISRYGDLKWGNITITKAEAIATACYTQNRSIIHRHFNKTPYEFIQGKKPDISYLYVFGALCYPKNDREDIGKLGAKGDIGFLIVYSTNSVVYRVYNQRTNKITETMNITSELKLAYASSTITPKRLSERDLDILFESFHNEYLSGRPSEAPRTIPVAPISSHNVDALSQQHAQQQRNHTPSLTVSAADNVLNAVFKGDLFVNPFATPSTESVVSSTQYVDPSNMHTFYQPHPHDYQ
nr:putative RNA-directed DNA polymerase [Tanacetum cinerariifolium]